MVNVVENVITKDYQDQLESLLMSDNFAWFFSNATCTGERNSFYSPNIFESSQFVHSFVKMGQLILIALGCCLAYVTVLL